jgi:integrase
MATLKKVENKKGTAYKIGFMHPETKKWTTKTIHTSYKVALRIKAEIEKDVAYGVIGKMNPELRKIFWSQLKAKYKNYAKRNKSPKTVDREKYILNNFDSFLMSDLPADKITPNTIDRFKENRIKDGASLSTVSIEIRCLRALFNKAVEWGVLRTNPVKGIKLPIIEEISVRFLRVNEIKDLMKVIEEDDNNDFLRLVLAYLNTGARRNELLPPLFTWDNVDFEENKILIHGIKRQTRRYIPMNKALRKVFMELKAMKIQTPFNFKPDFITHKIAKYYKVAEIEGANTHSLRKTFGSLLIQNKKADIYTVSKLLGHASVKTTEKYYIDLIDDNYQTAVDGLDEIL